MTGPASRPDPAVNERERRLDSAIAEYLQAAESGRAPDRRKFLARHRDLADDLLSFFGDEDRVRNLAGPMLRRGNDVHGGPPDGSFLHADPDSELQVGGELGDYELLEEIASGGMGVVFKARQKSLNRVVALKTIRPTALRPGDSAIQRFRIEAEAVARLDHPNIVPIFEMGELAGYPFLSLKLIEGGDLEQHISRFKADPRATAVLMAEVARAVHYAHLRGILHRDLKPSNILVDRRGRPYVTDFGLARCLESDSDLTHTGLILGTPSYMAPEQVSGPRNEVTTAADVYGLGAVLYTLISGRPPFQADTVYETLQHVREKEPVPPGMGDKAVNRDLEAICLKCLEKDPARRYATSEWLALDLEHWVDGGPIAARPAGSVERAWRWYRRNRLVARLWAGVAALFLAVPIITVLLFLRQRGLADEAFSAAQKERGARLLADARAEDIRWRLVRMNVANGVRLMEQGDNTGALPWFAEALIFDRDDPAAASTHRLRLGTLLNQCPGLDGLFVHTRPILWATLDPDGRRLATASADGTARVWDLDSGETIAVLPHDGPVNRVEFRSDGSRLVTASDDGTARVWDLDAGQPGPALRLEHGSPVRIALLHPDGRRVVSGGEDGTIRVWNAHDGTPLGPPHRLGSSLLDLVFSPDGTRIATGTAAGQAGIWRLEGDRLAGLALLPHRGAVRHVAFSPDGMRLVTASHDGTARLWDGRSGVPLTPPLTHAPNRRVSHAEFSPDGTRLVTASDDGTARVWDARTGRGLGPEDVTMSHSIGVGEASFSPDGARVVTAGLDGTARIWDAATAEPLSPPFYHGGSLTRARFTPDGYQVLTVGTDSTVRLWNVTDVGGSAVAVEDAGGIHHAAFDPKGRRFATAGANGTARVWDAATGDAITPPLDHRRSVTRVAFSPDGRRIATASDDGTAQVWDAATGRPVTYFLPHNGPVRNLRFSPDGSRLATASADGQARFWEVATGRTVLPPLEHNADVLDLAFSADGRWLATGGADGTAQVWDVTNGQPTLAPLENGASVSCVAFRPDGRVLLTACADLSFAELRAQQWDLTTGRPIGPPLRHGDGVLWAAYSHDGRRIATASEDRTARVWDAATGEPLTRPLTHQHQVLMAAFSPDGRRLATASLDGTARVWDAMTGEPLSPPLIHRDRTQVGSVAFQPDGRGLLTAGMDGTARIWSLPRDDRSSDILVLQAQVLAGRRIDQTGGEVPLETVKLSQAWVRLRAIESDSQTDSARTRSRSRIAWHRREARRLELSRQGKAAAWHLNRLEDLESGDSSLAARLVAAYEMSADWDRLEAAASRAIAAGTRDIEVGVRRGWARIHLGRPNDAVNDFHQALEREPDSAGVKLGLFLGLAGRGSQVEADALWSSVMTDRDETPVDRRNAIAVHLELLTNARPEAWWFWRARGHFRMRMGHPDQSEADYDRAIAVRPDDGWSWLGRGLARKQLGRTDDALADFARSAILAPRVASAWGTQGEIHGDRGRWDEAAREFARWAELGGDPMVMCWYFHAALRLYARDPDGYRHACLAMWERFSKTRDPSTATIVARACVLGEDAGIPPAQILELARQGARGNPRAGWPVSTLGAALRRAGNFEDASAQLDEASLIDPGWPGTPMNAALRELARHPRPLNDPLHPQDTKAPKAEPDRLVDLSRIQDQMAREKAPWHLQLEAALLARELDAIWSTRQP